MIIRELRSKLDTNVYANLIHQLDLYEAGETRHTDGLIEKLALYAVESIEEVEEVNEINQHLTQVIENYREGISE